MGDDVFLGLSELVKGFLSSIKKRRAIRRAKRGCPGPDVSLPRH